MMWRRIWRSADSKWRRLSGVEIPAETRSAFMATWLCGALPGEGIDKEALRKNLNAGAHPGVMQNSVTWGTAMAAMCAARLGEPERAIDLLVGKFDENPFRPSGYTVRRPDQTPMYMPANGGWLSAVAMMAAGWDGRHGRIAGAISEEFGRARHEGLLPMPLRKTYF